MPATGSRKLGRGSFCTINRLLADVWTSFAANAGGIFAPFSLKSADHKCHCAMNRLCWRI